MTTETRAPDPQLQELDRVTIRFAGDSGDGMQLTGTQFTRTAASSACSRSATSSAASSAGMWTCPSPSRR